MTTLTASRRPAATGTPPSDRPAPGPRARWERPALVSLLAGTAVLYLWGLDASGWGNSFYAAAAQAGSESWTAFFFGSSDAANAITVDKTPLALWPMSLSVRVFGLSSWSVLAPQAVEGVLAVWLLVTTVRRTTGSAAAGLLSGAVLALTPVAVLMFRFDNPDALLVLLLVAATAATLRAVEPTRHPARWLALAGALVGLAFLAKMMQAFLVLPALVLVYLVAGSAPLLKRLLHLLGAFVAMIAAAGWWVAIVSVWPADSRPYIGGSQTNSILELTLGYNGLGRLTGDEVGSVGGGQGWGETGLLRLLDTDNGGQIGWLLPAALVLLGAGLWMTRRAARTDRVRAALIAWGGWLVVTALTFSLMAGIFHAYYSVALAPAVAALVGIGAWLLWENRTSPVAIAAACGTVSLTSVLGFLLLGRTPDFLPWLRWAVLVVGLLSAVALSGLSLLPRRIVAAVAGAALVACLAGPTAYAVHTAATPHTGSIVTAGPGTGSGGPGGGPGAGQGQTQGQTQGATGGLLTGSDPSAALTDLLAADADSYTWVAAAVGSNSASGYQLATERPVMAIGGFNGSDPSPTLAEFQAHVADGEIHYFIASDRAGGGPGGGAGGGPGGGPGALDSSGTSSEISTWVESTFTATTVDGVTLYDLSPGVAG